MRRGLLGVDWPWRDAHMLQSMANVVSASSMNEDDDEGK
jgi:hypothetical protein